MLAKQQALSAGRLRWLTARWRSYQILDRDRAAGEGSFIQAKGALSITDPAIKASATGMVYRDVSEAFWTAGDRARAIAVFKEGRAAGGDQYLFYVLSPPELPIDSRPISIRQTNATLPHRRWTDRNEEYRHGAVDRIQDASRSAAVRPPRCAVGCWPTSARNVLHRSGRPDAAAGLSQSRQSGCRRAAERRDARQRRI